MIQNNNKILYFFKFRMFVFITKESRNQLYKGGKF